MNKMKILAIIVTYNAMRWIDKCVESLLNSAIPVDIFVKDNGSTDGSMDYIKNLCNNRIVKLVGRLSENLDRSQLLLRL